jgi:hypothetical protein
MAKNDSIAALPKEKPSIRLDETDYPELKDCKVDDECTFTVKAKVTEVGRERWTNDKRLWGTFQVLSVKSEDGDALAKGMDSVKPSKVARKT